MNLARLLVRSLTNAKFLSNQKGGTFLTTVMMTAGMTAAAVTILDLTDIGKGQALLALNEDKAQLANSRLVSAAENMIAGNIIWCREYEGEISDEMPMTGNCKWGGDKLKAVNNDDDSLKASPEDYHFEVVSEQEKEKEGFESFLTYKFNDYSTDIANVVSWTYIGFRLVDWSKQNSYENLIGGIPDESLEYDNDSKVVLIKVKTKFAPDNESSSDNLEARATSSIVTYSDVRRPFTEIKIDAGKAEIACAAFCQTNLSMDPNYPCRGPQEFHDSKAKVPLVITNNGPGIIYRLSLDVKTTYNPEWYTDKNTGKNKEEFRRSLDIVRNTEEPLLPGQSKRITDYIECKYMKRIIQETEYLTQATSNSALQGQERDAGSRVEKRLEQHSDDGGSVDYSVDVSCFDQEALDAEQFILKGGDCDNLPEEFKSKSMAILEPNRIFESELSETEADTGLPTTYEEFAEVKTIIRFVAVPSH